MSHKKVVNIETECFSTLNRRTFLKSVLAATVVPKAVGVSGNSRRVSPNEKINLACVGIAHQGRNMTRTFGNKDMTNIVALCDVDLGSPDTREILESYPDAKRFQDFRVMLDKMGNEIDGLIISTPDHSHFPIAMLAMSMGKHVFIEKPLANTFEETELMMAAERKYKVAAQMGNQGHSGNNYFQFESWTKEGIIKDVTKVTAFMNSRRVWHDWEIDGYPDYEEIPDTLDWDLWHATVKKRPYSSKLHPGNWRGWFRYGNGAFGDWGPHILDTIHRFCDLGLPTEIEAVKRDGPNPYIFPQASTIRFKFPARGSMPPVEITWYDGQENKPPLPDEFEGREVRNQGKIIYTKDLVFYGGTHGDIVRIIPEDRMREMASELPRFAGAAEHSDHYDNFLLAIKGQEECRSSLDISGPLCQVFCLGSIAQELGGTLIFDRETKKIKDNKIANDLLTGPSPRKDWQQYYKL